MSIYFVYLVYVGQGEQNNFVPLVPLLWATYQKKKIALSRNATGSLLQYSS